MQSRLHSAIESIVNILVGFSVNWWANMLILPMFGYTVSVGTALSIGLIFTAISLVRSYVLRRAFNHWHRKQYEPERTSGDAPF